jgi:hypothetical protein
MSNRTGMAASTIGGYMKLRLGVALMLLLTAGTSASAAERVWQKGIWREVRITRPRVVIGLQPSPNAPGPYTPSTTLVRTYVIETDAERFELKDMMPAARRTVDAMVGEEVTFAVEKNTLYVRASSGLEHRLRITKKVAATARD